MDAEDLADLQGGQKLVARAEYARAPAAAPAPAAAGGSGLELGERLTGLLRVSDTAENAGWAMLRRMGWREGFGVGARAWRGGKSGGAAGGAKKVYGCARGPAEAERMASASKAEDELTSADAGGALFAPRPTEEVEIVPKSDRFGLAL